MSVGENPQVSGAPQVDGSPGMQLGSTVILENLQVKWPTAYQVAGLLLRHNLSSDLPSALTCAYAETDGADIAECRHRLLITAALCSRLRKTAPPLVQSESNAEP
jgi:hypothetical protein